MRATIWEETGTIVKMEGNECVERVRGSERCFKTVSYTVWLRINSNKLIRFDNVKDEDISIIDTPKS